MILKALSGFTIMLVVYCAFLTYKNTSLESDLLVATVQKNAAETSARTAEAELELTTIQLNNYAEKIVVIEKERDKARIQVDKMVDIFQDHDFAKLLTNKPGLIENLMVKKTRKVFDEIEVLTAD